MSTLEARLEEVERTMAEHDGALVGLRADLADFRTMTGQRFDAVDQRFEKLEEKMAAGFRWMTVLMVMIFGVMLTAYVALATTIAVM